MSLHTELSFWWIFMLPTFSNSRLQRNIIWHNERQDKETELTFFEHLLQIVRRTDGWRSRIDILRQACFSNSYDLRHDKPSDWYFFNQIIELCKSISGLQKPNELASASTRRTANRSKFVSICHFCTKLI